MTTLTVTVSDNTRAFLEEQAAEEGFPSPGEYVQSLIRQAQLRRARQELDAKIRRALQEPATEMTEEDWAELRREVAEPGSERRDPA